MTKANEHRGEVELALGETKLLLRPSYSAISEWESVCNAGSVQLLYKMSTATYRLAEVVAIVGAAARAGGQKITDQKVGELLIENGVIEAVPVIAKMIAGALTGGKDPEESEPDEGEATAAETAESPSAA